MKPEELTEALRRNLISRRKELKMTQVQLAERTGLAQPSISSFESGETVPTVQTLAKLATALKTQPDTLLRVDVFSSASA